METKILRFTLDDGTECQLALDIIFEAKNGQSYAALYRISTDGEVEEDEWAWETAEEDEFILLRAIPKPLDAAQQSADGEQPEPDYALESITDEQEYRCARDAYTEILMAEVIAEMESDDYVTTMDTEIDGERYRIVDIFLARRSQYAALVKRSELFDDEKNYFLYRYEEFDYDDGTGLYTEIKVSPIQSSMEYEEVEEVFKNRLEEGLNMGLTIPQ